MGHPLSLIVYITTCKERQTVLECDDNAAAVLLSATPCLAKGFGAIHLALKAGTLRCRRTRCFDLYKLSDRALRTGLTWMLRQTGREGTS